MLFALAGSAPGSADLRPPARPRGEPPPMRFVRVVSADPECAPNCPEWLSAEGRIEPGSAPAFAEALDRLAGRRLPILIHSPGGSVIDAMAMGKLIRARGLAVAVARTLMPGCPEAAPRCADGPGRAMTGGAICASACVFVLAGGVERLVGPVPLVGVHQITTVVKETEGLSRLTSTRKYYEQEGADGAVSAYLADMGIGDPVMDVLRKTPAASVHWLSLGDLRASRLATLAIDPAEPILVSGANGLNGRAFEGDAQPDGLFEARLSEPIAPIEGGGARLDMTLRYRLGGGAIEAELAARDADAGKPIDPPAAGFSLTLAPPAGEALTLTIPGAAPARASVPRERFCAIARGGKLVVSPASPASGAWANAPPVAFGLAGTEGWAAIVEEACP